MMPMQSPMKNEMHDDHDNREAANCGEWVSSPEEAARRITEQSCYDMGNFDN